MLVFGVVLACKSNPAPAPASPAAPAGPITPVERFPGFALAVPEGKRTEDNTSYVTGYVALETRDGRRISIRWGAGELADDDVAKTIATDRANGLASSAEYIPLAAGGTSPTIVSKTADGKDERLSAIACGTRRFFIDTTGGSDNAAAHAALVRSFTCQSDPAREPAPGVIRVAIDLPGFVTQPKGRMLGQLNLTDGKATNIILREMPIGTAQFAREELTFVEDVVLDGSHGQLHLYSGRHGTQQIRGFVVEKRCESYHVRINAYVLAEHEKALDAVITPILAARCLHRDEKPPVWPDR
jgi:hypothetical protein